MQRITEGSTVSSRSFDASSIPTGACERGSFSVASCNDVSEVKDVIDRYNRINNKVNHFAISEVIVLVTYSKDIPGTIVVVDSMTHRHLVEIYPPLEDAGND